MPSSKAGIMTISLAEAEIVVAGAIQQAKEIGVKVCVTVCDAGGRFVLLNRMDGAPWATVFGSKGKAIASAGFCMSTGRLVDRPHWGVVRDEKTYMILDFGGVAIFKDGLAIGGVGVDGATGQQDEACARAGIAKLQRTKEPART